MDAEALLRLKVPIERMGSDDANTLSNVCLMSILKIKSFPFLL